MSRTRLVLAATCTAVAGLLTCACHEPEQPPVPPPNPTNPTNASIDLALAGGESDASIVREAGPVPPGDAGILFDAAPVAPR